MTSYMRIPLPSEDKLPDFPSEESDMNLAPIVVTLAKCRKQMIAALVITLGAFMIGSVFGWSAVAVADLKAENKLKFDEATASSICIIGGLVGGPVAGYLMLYGRKKATIGFAMLASVGWLFICLAKFIPDNDGAVSMLYMGRIITGVWTGFAGSACLLIAPAYVREICNDEYRSLTGGMVPIMIQSGNFYAFVIGSYTSWFWLSVACLIVPCVLCVGMIWIPESPRCLYSMFNETSKGEDEAQKAFFWLTSEFTNEEQNRLFKRVKRAMEFLSNTKRAMRRSQRIKSEKRKKIKLTSRVVLRPMILSTVLMFFQQMCGIGFLATYIVDVFQASGGLLDPHTGTTLTGAFLVMFAGITLYVIDRMGRKPLLLIGAGTMTVTLFALGLFFYLKLHDSPIVHYLSWIPIISIILYMAAYALGLGTVTWTLAAEINHPDFKETSGTLISTTYWLTGFVVSMSLPALRDAIGYHYCFVFYGCISLAAFIFIAIAIFETKGKTVEEIMAHYQGYVHSAEDEENESRSLGSINPRHSRRGRASGDSAESDWSSDFQTLYHPKEDSANSTVNVQASTSV